jgi:phosphoglycolate phosphatase
MFANVTTVVWDWNGTLINDLMQTVAVTDAALEALGHQPIGLQHYQAIFSLPITEYYCHLPLHPKDYDAFTALFLHNYAAYRPSLQLYSGAHDLLQGMHQRGIRHVILSAYTQHALTDWIDSLGIGDYIDAIFGAKSGVGGGCKQARGRELVAQMGLDPGGCVYVGDTVHDAQVALNLGMRPLLLGCGHNSIKRLRAVSGGHVFSDFTLLKQAMIR